LSPRANTIPQQLDVTIPSDPSAIGPVRRSVEQVAASAGMDERAAADLGLCVNEALANVMRHAYGGATGRPIAVSCHCQGEELVVTIRDWGNGVNPAELPPKAYDPLEPGGLGLICLKQMLTDVTYVPQPDGMLLVMKKRTTKAKTSAAPGGGAAARNPRECGHE
jgi:anti-sigma regulatory factor (Ser/Thr protein kinase)